MKSLIPNCLSCQISAEHTFHRSTCSPPRRNVSTRTPFVVLPSQTITRRLNCCVS